MIAGIIGATGYTGTELLRLLSGHPEIKEIVLASVNSQGESIASLYPNFLEICPGHILVSPEDLIS
ncbi:MAG: N-acetyl-gamma-glutamyl-phosphate reductase, partial [Treponema sp.]|nr:N-acetyl-gamma-glutamyl-phosphate reductase [Treponema sp.]